MRRAPGQWWARWWESSRAKELAEIRKRLDAIDRALMLLAEAVAP